MKRNLTVLLSVLLLVLTLATACRVIVPTVKFKNVTALQTSITFEVEVTDPSKIFTIDKIELFQGEERVQKAASVQDRAFSGLTPDTEYVIKLTYSYDVGNGKGKQTFDLSQTVKTLQE